MTIPIPVRAVPKNSKKRPLCTLMTSPMSRTTNPTKIARTYPSLFPIAEEKREKVAKASKGKVVKNPANVLERSKSSRMAGINGPTPVMDGLRQKETRTIAENSIQLDCCGPDLLCIYLLLINYNRSFVTRVRG